LGPKPPIVLVKGSAKDWESLLFGKGGVMGERRAKGKVTLKRGRSLKVLPRRRRKKKRGKEIGGERSSVNELSVTGAGGVPNKKKPIH